MTSRTGDAAQEDGDRDRMFVTALARGLDVLRAFDGEHRPLGNQEIAHRANLPKATVCRMTHTLTQLGYLRTDPASGKYRLDVGVLSLGYAALSSLGYREVARPFLRELADATRASVSIGRRDRNAMVYVETLRGRGPMTLNLAVGGRIPLATTAMGKAWFALTPEPERSQAMDQQKPLFGPDWPSVQRGVEQGIEDHAVLGFTRTTGEWQPAIHAVGRAIRLPEDQSILCFNCGAPAVIMPADRLSDDYGPRLVQTVAQIEARLARR